MIEALDPAADLAYRNIRRMLEMRALWSPHVRQVSLVTADRVFFKASDEMHEVLDGMTPRSFRRGPSSGGPHNLVRQLYDFTRWRRVISWRSLSRPSLQVTLHEAHRDTWTWVGDADIDLGNPVMDVLGAIVHFVEVIMPGKTSHRKLEARIDRDYQAWQRRDA